MEKKSNLGKVIGRAIIVVDAAIQFIKRLNDMTGANSTQWITFIGEEFGNVIPFLKKIIDVSDTFKETFDHIFGKIGEAIAKFFYILSDGIQKANNFLDKLIYSRLERNNLLNMLMKRQLLTHSVTMLSSLSQLKKVLAQMTMM